jgi:hypothetical protein
MTDNLIRSVFGKTKPVTSVPDAARDARTLQRITRRGDGGTRAVQASHSGGSIECIPPAGVVQCHRPRTPVILQRPQAVRSSDHMRAKARTGGNQPGLLFASPVCRTRGPPDEANQAW